MDLASIIGLVLGFGLFIFGCIVDSSFNVNFGTLGNFVDIPSAIITFGGTLSAMITSNSLGGFVNNIKGAKRVFSVPKNDEAAIIRQIIDLSNVARKEGLLALEESANNLEDEFMKKGILLIVDGTDPELVRNILDTELINVDTRHKNVIGFWKNMAAMGPAWGMIGTLVGLINMLKDLNDPDSIGPNMAVALITTLYGSLLANWLSTPIANKLAAYNDAEITMKEVMIEGLLSIQAGENPRVIEEKLKSFLSPKARKGVNDEGGDEVG
ncbi:MAG: motility protein A [Lachnospiraceae bacterium]|nr:motility protein A [Lachnospiraceae bacterium]